MEDQQQQHYQQQPQYPQYPQQPQQYSQYPQQPGYPPGQYPPQPPVKKKRSLLWLWIVIGIIALVVVCSAIGVAASQNGNTGTAVTTKQQQSNTTAPAPPAKHFTVGQAVNVGSTFEVTVNSVKTSAGDTTFQPKAGNQYFLVDVSIKNISAKSQSISSLVQWKLRDATGLEYTETIGDFGTAPDGNVEAGAPIRGVFTYEVPTTTKSFTLAFTPDFLDTGATTWDLTA